jgi:hypothetical protein
LRSVFSVLVKTRRAGILRRGSPVRKAGIQCFWGTIDHYEE